MNEHNGYVDQWGTWHGSATGAYALPGEPAPVDYRALAERLAAALSMLEDYVGSDIYYATPHCQKYVQRCVAEAREAGLLPEAAVRGEG